MGVWSCSRRSETRVDTCLIPLCTNLVQWEEAYLAKYGEQLARAIPAAEPGPTVPAATADPGSAALPSTAVAPGAAAVQLLDPVEAPRVQAASSGSGTSS
jgi:hypothetical protein